MKVVIITDAIRAFGLDMVSELCREGYFVIAIARNGKESELIKKTVLHRYSFAQIEAFAGSYSSVRELRQIVLNIRLLATEYKFDSIYALLCNQERVYGKFVLNEDGIERTFMENYFVNIFLAESLLDFLQKEDNSRVIVPTLPQNQLVGINMNAMFKESTFDPQTLIRQCKFANAMMAGYINQNFNSGEHPVRAIMYEARDVATDDELDNEKEQGKFARLFNKPTEFEVLMNTIIATINDKTRTATCYRASKPVPAPAVCANKDACEKFWHLSEKLTKLKYFDY